MATLIGVVSQVVGEVYAVAGDGTRRPLVEGDRLFAGEQIVTGAAGAIAVAMRNGQQLTLGRDSSLMLTEQMLAYRPDVQPQGADTTPAAPSDDDLTDVERLQAAIEAGVDPTLEGEATAAGPGAGGAAGGAGGGHSFVLLDEVGGALDPLIGFPTEGLNSSPEFPDPDPIVLLDEPEVIVDGSPQGGEASNAVDEEGLEGGIIGGPGDLDGEQVFVTGVLGYSFGPDGVGGFTWNTSGLSELGLTSGGVALTYVVGNGGLTLTAFAGEIPVFELNLTNLLSGAYSFELFAPLDHSAPPEGVDSDENDIDISFSYTITDGNGTPANGSLTITIDDDSPTAGLAEQAPELGTVLVDESLAAPAGQGDGVAQAVLLAATVQAQFASAFGADGAGSQVYSLVLDSGDADSVGSGLYAVDPNAPDGKGEEILLSQVGDVVSGKVGDTTYFTLSIDPETGEVTLDLLLNIWHGDSSDADDAEVLQLDEGVLLLKLTVTDADGDSASASIDLGAAGVFSFEDDAPILSSVQNLVLANGVGSITGFADIAYGADGFGSINIGGDAPEGVTYNVTTLEGGAKLLTATWDGTGVGDDPSDDLVYFTLQFNPDGTYEFTMVNPPAPDPINLDFTTVPSGSFSYLYFDAQGNNGDGQWGADKGSIKDDVALADAEIKITASSSLNPSGQGIGVGNNHFETTETITFEFLSAEKPTSFTLSTQRDAGSTANLVVRWEAWSLGVMVAYGYVLLNSASQELVFDPPGEITFDKLVLVGEPTGAGPFTVDNAEGSYSTQAGAKFTLVNASANFGYSYENQDLEFEVSYADGDGDTTAVMALTVHVEAETTTPGGGYVLTGTAGADAIKGGSGADTLIGGDGDDILIGGLGNDTLTGGEGADTFVFAEVGAGHADLITDYSFAEGDKIDLTALLEANFNMANASDFVRLAEVDSVTKLQVNLAGDGVEANFVEVATLNGVNVGDQVLLLIGDQEYTV
jgi:T1SS-143 domain-containing protein